MTGTDKTEKFGLPPEQLDRLFEKMGVDLVRDRDQRRRAAEWPGQVETLLVALAHKVATLEARLAQVEAHEAS